MKLTDIGASVAGMTLALRFAYGYSLLKGESTIFTFIEAPICYDAVAYVRFLLSDSINLTEIKEIIGPQWKNVFKFTGGIKWDGRTDFERGQAIGFYRLIDQTVFHAAVATGNGAHIRAVNGHRLGAGWSDEPDVKSVLGRPDREGAFTYDNTKVNVYIPHV